MLYWYPTVNPGYRSVMTRLVSNMAPIIPQTTAKEVLSKVQQLVQQRPKEGVCHFRCCVAIYAVTVTKEVNSI